MRCPHCPAGPGDCRGEAVRRFCELVDPASESYLPAYARILLTDDVHVTDEQRAESFLQAMIHAPGIVPESLGGCCG